MLELAIQLYRLANNPSFDDDNIFSAEIVYKPQNVDLIQKLWNSNIVNFREVTVDNNIILSPEDFNTNTGQKITFKYFVPIKEGNTFYKNVSDLATKNSKGLLPSNYYIVDIDYASGEELLDSRHSKLKRLIELSKVVAFLDQLSSYHNKTNYSYYLSLVYIYNNANINPSVIEIETKITEDLLEIETLDFSLLENFCLKESSNNPDYLATKAIFISSLGEFLASVPTKETFSKLIKDWKAFCDLFNGNLATYMSGFSLQKAKKDVAEAELKIAEQLSKVLNDIIIKLLGIPVSFAAISIIIKQNTTILEKLITLIGLLTTSFVIAEAISNQQALLNRVIESKDIIFNGIDGNKNKYPDELKNKISEIISFFEEKQIELKLLLNVFRITAWLPVIFGSVIFCFKHFNSFDCHIGILTFLILLTVVLVFYCKKIYNVIKKNNINGNKWYSNLLKRVFLY